MKYVNELKFYTGTFDLLLFKVILGFDRAVEHMNINKFAP